MISRATAGLPKSSSTGAAPSQPPLSTSSGASTPRAVAQSSASAAAAVSANSLSAAATQSPKTTTGGNGGILRGIREFSWSVRKRSTSSDAQQPPQSTPATVATVSPVEPTPVKQPRRLSIFRSSDPAPPLPVKPPQPPKTRRKFSIVNAVKSMGHGGNGHSGNSNSGQSSGGAGGPNGNISVTALAGSPNATATTSAAGMSTARSSARASRSSHHAYSHHTTPRGDESGEQMPLSNLLDGEIDLAQILSPKYLDKLRRAPSAQSNGATSSVASSTSAEDDDNDSTGSDSDDAATVDDMETYRDPYDVAWSRIEASERERSEQRRANRKSGAASLLTSFPLSLPRVLDPGGGANNNADSPTRVGQSERGWGAPESWGVTVDTSAIVKRAVPGARPGEITASIRVFRRDGTFSTLVCPLSIVAKDLCGLLVKKFFIQSDVKYHLWLVRSGRESLVAPTDQPLKLQQRWLWEIGYDPTNDKFQDILREDNSYLYRWVFSEVSSFQLLFNTILQSAGTDKPFTPITTADRRIVALARVPGDPLLLTANRNSMDFSELNIDTMPEALLKHCKGLLGLNLQKNVGILIPRDFAQMCQTLTSLSLAWTGLKTVPDAIALIPSLESLDLSHNQISSLRNSDMQNLKALRVLRLRNNKLIGRNALPLDVTCNWTRLEVLDLSCNWIKGEMPKSILYIGLGSGAGGRHGDLVNASQVNYRASVSSQNGDTGGPRNSLLELDLSYNAITSLGSDFTRRLPSLRRLYLVSNHIAKLPENFLSAMQSLEELDVRGNQLRGIVGSLPGVVTLQEPANGTLKATGTNTLGTTAQLPISRQNSTDPASTSNVSLRSVKDRARLVSKLLLDNNNVSELRLAEQWAHLRSVISHRNPDLLQVSITSKLVALSTLVLSYSRLAFLPEELFEHTPALQVLILNNNQLSSLPQSVTCLKSLVRLELAHNSISTLPGAIKEWQSLEIMDLHSNNLKEVPAEIWELRIKFLNLSSNVIEQWPENPYSSHSTGNNSTNAQGERSSTMHISSKLSSSPLVESASRTTGLQSEGSAPAMNLAAHDSDHVASPTGSLTSLPAPLSYSLQRFSVADNRIESGFFDNPIQHLCSLRSLNASHNDIFTVPHGSLRTSATTLEELYLSGNHLTQLPDDLFYLTRLCRLHINGNRLGSLPPELGKIANLRVLDVGRNQLRYNVGNWPYDWNWNWNVELRYLNLSGNPRLEIRSAAAAAIGANNSTKKDKHRDKVAQIDVQPDGEPKGDIARFDNLSKMRVLGLLDVNVTVPVPEEHGGRRVRVCATGGASAHWRKQIGADAELQAKPSESPAPQQLQLAAPHTTVGGGTTAAGSHLTLSVSGATNSTMGGSSLLNNPASPSQTTLDNNFTTTPSVQYGVSDSLGDYEKSTTWDLVILNGKFSAMARDDGKQAAPADPPVDDQIRQQGKKKSGATSGECMFGMFEARDNRATWLGKCLTDQIVHQYAGELKRAFKERKAQQIKTAREQQKEKEKGGASQPPPLPNMPTATDFGSVSDAALIQHALRRSFLVINKNLGLQAKQAEQALRTKEREMSSKYAAETPAAADTASLPRGGRKHSVSFETNRQSGKIKKIPVKPSAVLANVNSNVSIASNVSADQSRMPVGQGKEVAFRRKFSIVDQVSDVYNSRNGKNITRPLPEMGDSNKLPSSSSSLGLLVASQQDSDIADVPFQASTTSCEQPAQQQYLQADESDSEDDVRSADDNHAHMMDTGCSALVALLAQNQLFVANCGDSMAVLCRNGSAIAVSVRHTLFSFQSTTDKDKDKVQKVPAAESIDSKKSTTGDKSDTNAAASAAAAALLQQQTDSFARRELMRVRHCAAYISRDGLLSDRSLHTRGFGNFVELPSVNAAPYITVTDLTDHDEFIVIGSAAFWRTMTYQMAVDVARLKADDALEASMVLRDFAVAYAQQAVYTVDMDSEFPEDKLKLAASQKAANVTGADSFRRLRQDAISVMVINVKDWLGGKPKKVFTKVKRRREEAVDSALSRLAPEVEPPTGHVALVFTDVRNSTQLWERMPIAMRVAIRDHNLIMRRNLRFFNGYEVKTEGDAFMVSFKSVLDALRWCMTSQLQLLKADWPQEILDSYDGQEIHGSSNELLYRGLSIRMGVHCGVPVSELDPVTRRMDYFGPVVNKTARVAGAAEGGQILISQDVEKIFKKLRSAPTKDASMGSQNALASLADGQRKARPASTVNEKLLDLIQLDPSFIGIGERRLKGFDNAEKLLSVLPKALLGRLTVPPPPLVPEVHAAPAVPVVVTEPEPAPPPSPLLISKRRQSLSMSEFSTASSSSSVLTPSRGRPTLYRSESASALVGVKESNDDTTLDGDSQSTMRASVRQGIRSVLVKSGIFNPFVATAEAGMSIAAKLSRSASRAPSRSPSIRQLKSAFSVDSHVDFYTPTAESSASSSRTDPNKQLVDYVARLLRRLERNVLTRLGTNILQLTSSISNDIAAMDPLQVELGRLVAHNLQEQRSVTSVAKPPEAAPVPSIMFSPPSVEALTTDQPPPSPLEALSDNTISLDPAILLQIVTRLEWIASALSIVSAAPESLHTLLGGSAVPLTTGGDQIYPADYANTMKLLLMLSLKARRHQ